MYWIIFSKTIQETSFWCFLFLSIKRTHFPLKVAYYIDFCFDIINKKNCYTITLRNHAYVRRAKMK